MQIFYSFKRNSCVIIFLIGVLCLSSCGTLFYTKSYDDDPALTITSSQPNSEVYINGNFVGYTPYSYFGSMMDVKKITVKKDGFKSESIKPRKLKGWVYVNFVPYPMWNWIWGYFVDKKKAKCWKYKSDVFHFELKEKNKK